MLLIEPRTMPAVCTAMTPGSAGASAVRLPERSYQRCRGAAASPAQAGSPAAARRSRKPSEEGNFEKKNASC